MKQTDVHHVVNDQLKLAWNKCCHTCTQTSYH